MTRLAENIRKPWLKATLKEIENLISNQIFMIEDPKDGEPVTPCMDVYKANIQSDGSLDKLKLRIVVRGGLQNKDMIGDTWSPTAINPGINLRSAVINSNISVSTRRYYHTCGDIIIHTTTSHTIVLVYNHE